MDHLISRAVINLDRGFGLTPMNQGIRSVGTVELGGLKNPPSKKRIKYIINCAKELLPQLGAHEDEWLGFRPTLPDCLPVIGPSLKNKNIIYAFGHHHLGWTLGADNWQNCFWNSCRRENKFRFISLQLKKI